MAVRKRKPVKAGVNVANVRKLARFVESGRRGFNMRYADAWDCNTPLCILGHARVLWPGDSITEATQDRLGINDDAVVRLFFTTRDKSGEIISFSRINRRMAVAALRRLARTGKVYFDPADAKPRSRS